MSANNKNRSHKNHKLNKSSKLFFSLLLYSILIIVLAFSMIYCQKEEVPKYNIVVLEQKDKTNIPDETTLANITETNQTSITQIIPDQSGEREIKQNETRNESINETINKTVAQGQGQEQIPARASAVEFYFLLKGKSYFKYTLKETELKAFNLSGTIIKIIPVFIANDSVVFKVDDYPTGAVGEREWYSTPGFEIYVNAIYYRR